MHAGAGPEQSDIRWLQRFENLQRALAQLRAAIAAHQAMPENDLIVIALIKAYEFSFELSWKTLKDLLAWNGIDARLPREVLKQAPAGFSAATKCFCTEHEVRVANFVSRVFGPEATLWSDITHGLLYTPGYTIMGGTSNVMRNILGERVLGLPR